MPFPIHALRAALSFVGDVALVELPIITWIRWRSIEGPLRAAARSCSGGALVLAEGIVIGGA